ncbi:hypothetical protein PG994_001475 [Apiospora phragmitis]|uniref:Uncharacterized protein n=1 Tax=Apiospora phragmitis TaxID=2905665 RepID=A0ABR1WTM5_9PEZI
MRRRALAMTRPIINHSAASMLEQHGQDCLWEAVQLCIRDVTTHHLDHSAPNTLFPYDTKVARAVKTDLSDNPDMLQFDMGDGKKADMSLPNEFM